MALLKQKMVWIGLLILMLVFVIFGAAMMGSVVSVKPKNVPVALVVLDQSVDLPTGGKLAIGETLKEKLTANKQLPLTWTVVATEEEARAGLDDREYYGALVLPADLSAGVASIMSPTPKAATALVIANEGLNSQAATVVKQGLGLAIKMVNTELSKSMLEQMGKATGQIPVASAQALLSPINVTEETVHAVGTNNATGNAPGMLTQIMWMGSLVTAMVLFLSNGSARKTGAGRWGTLIAQPIVGTVFVGFGSGFLVWMASSWYGMELAQATATWMFLWLAGSAFFLLQSALLNWIGFPAMGILVLLMFFSMPLLNMAPEFLSAASHDWIYSWTPLKFVAVGLREVMYFGGLGAASDNAAVLWSIAGGFLVLLLLSGLKKGKATTAVNSAA
ncbi:YhgE/Pip N-terminal domain protein [Paenibacillus curdlanolyticus YK9]|uniref:YhgE/Pip N-terminal domain protein n=1 Tax=Paenibacillus curdlanolyticus YK9 TaxID=717606 RepID=E0IFZ8_9BACL|nr:ABC transporter permease [Paenibacillus curdlanolyticus]EFM08578.1 YhgE/Pip N-terminal domain protein [Paenibacillus curdlanolyticus YK9]